jgi:hypothetical protein
MKRFIWLVLLASAVAGAQTDSTPTKDKVVETKKAEASTSSTMPTLDGGIGACSAEFRVVGGDNKPLYNAQVHTLIKYGAFGVKKLDLQGSTNADGKIKFTGLPDVNKRPVFFDIKQGTKTAQRAFEPGAECHPVFEVILQ